MSVVYAAIEQALEALADGDQAHAVAVLVSALEDAPARREPFRCWHCGLRFDWPGLRDSHEFQAHGGRRRP